MSKLDRYVFMPSFSLEPNKATSYNSVFLRDRVGEELVPIQSLGKTRRNSPSKLQDKNEVKRSSHNFRISENAYRTLKRRINWLHYLAKSKRITTYSGKTIFNFRVGFITLTLPSKQRTCTKELTDTCLNQFLTEIRQRTGMQNYVWRLEFQKNGNAHYHLVTDTYIDYFFVRKIWNRILDKAGYIEPYRDKFKNMSLKEYATMSSSNSNREYSQIVKSYARSKRENWSNPNSVDVKSVNSNQSIASYLSKYFAKSSDDETICNEFDTDENSKSLRLWFCSRSLSKLNTVNGFCEEVDFDIFAIVKACKDVKTVVLKYATSFYFELKKLKHWSRMTVERILREYAFGTGYTPAPT